MPIEHSTNFTKCKGKNQDTHTLVMVKERPSTGVLKKFSLKNFAKFTGKNTCTRISFLMKLQAIGDFGRHRCFLVNYVKFFRTVFC